MRQQKRLMSIKCSKGIQPLEVTQGVRETMNIRVSFTKIKVISSQKTRIMFLCAWQPKFMPFSSATNLYIAQFPLEITQGVREKKNIRVSFIKIKVILNQKTGNMFLCAWQPNFFSCHFQVLLTFILLSLYVSHDRTLTQAYIRPSTSLRVIFTRPRFSLCEAACE